MTIAEGATNPENAEEAAKRAKIDAERKHIHENWLIYPGDLANVVRLPGVRNNVRKCTYVQGYTPQLVVAHPMINGYFLTADQMKEPKLTTAHDLLGKCIQLRTFFMMYWHPCTAMGFNAELPNEVHGEFFALNKKLGIPDLSDKMAKPNARELLHRERARWQELAVRHQLKMTSTVIPAVNAAIEELRKTDGLVIAEARKKFKNSEFGNSPRGTGRDAVTPWISELQEGFAANMRRAKVETVLMSAYAPVGSEMGDATAGDLAKNMRDYACLAVIHAIKQWQMPAFEEARMCMIARDVRMKNAAADRAKKPKPYPDPPAIPDAFSPADTPTRNDPMIRALFWVESMCAYTSLLIHLVHATAGAEAAHDSYTPATFTAQVRAFGVYLAKMTEITRCASRAQRGLEIEPAAARIKRMLVIPDDATTQIAFPFLPSENDLFDSVVIARLTILADARPATGAEVPSPKLLEAVTKRKTHAGTVRGWLEHMLECDAAELKTVAREMAIEVDKAKTRMDAEAAAAKKSAQRMGTMPASR